MAWFHVTYQIQFSDGYSSWGIVLVDLSDCEISASETLEYASSGLLFVWNVSYRSRKRRAFPLCEQLYGSEDGMDYETSFRSPDIRV